MGLQRPSRSVQCILFAAALVVLLPSLVSGTALGALPSTPDAGNCSCGSAPADSGLVVDKSKALTLKIWAIASILVASAIGVCLPIFGAKVPALSPERNVFYLVKAFAAGVILATGFIHILPDAFDHLSNPLLTSSFFSGFPAAGFFAMVAGMVTLMIDTLSTSYFSKGHSEKKGSSASNGGGGGDVEKSGEDYSGQRLPVHTHATHGHSHGSGALLSDAAYNDGLKFTVIALVLEAGIVVHSVIIGLSLGVSMTPSTIKPLVAALTFHQFFEGMGLGGCIMQANFKVVKVLIMSVAFAVTTPAGIGIGIAVANSYDENSPKALIVEGILNALAAGILIYMALVDLLAADFMSSRMQGNLKLLLSAYFFLLFGAACMTLLAKWA